MSTTVNQEQRFEFQRQADNQSADSDRQESQEEAAVCSPVCQEQQEPLDPDHSVSSEQRQRPIAPNNWSIPEYLTSDKGRWTVTHKQAIRRQRRELVGQIESSEKNGFDNKFSRARRKYFKICQTGRRLRDKWQNCHTALLSLRLSPTVSGNFIPLGLLIEDLHSAYDNVRRALQYHLGEKRSLDYEYACVYAGTEGYATPHMHVLVWVNGEVDREAFTPTVEAFVSNTQYSPDDGSGNLPADAVTLRSPEEIELATDAVKNEKAVERYGYASSVATYVGSQLANVAHPYSAEDYELLFGAACAILDGNPWHFSGGCVTPGNLDHSVSPEQRTSPTGSPLGQEQQAPPTPVERTAKAREQREQERGGRWGRRDSNLLVKPPARVFSLSKPPEFRGEKCAPPKEKRAGMQAELLSKRGARFGTTTSLRIELVRSIAGSPCTNPRSCTSRYPLHQSTRGGMPPFTKPRKLWL